MSAPPRVVASVVSGADPEAIVSFVRSLSAEAARARLDLTTVAIVNSGSPELVETLRRVADEGVGRTEVVANPRPAGFATNHGRVMSAHTGDYHLVANDDVVVLEGALDRLIAFMERPENARVAVASPQLLNEDGSVQGSTYGFPSVARALLPAAGIRRAQPLELLVRLVSRFALSGRTRYWAHDRPMLVDSVRGAFALVRRAAIDDVGLMDEISLVGGEELEWHRRMARTGWRVAFVPEARVVHVGSVTVGSDLRLRAEYLKGLLNYFEKHGSRLDVGLLRVAAALSSALRLAVVRDGVSRELARSCLSVAARWPRLWEAACEDGAVRASRMVPSETRPQ